MRTVLAIITKNKQVLLGKVKVEKIEEYGGIAYAFPSLQPYTEESIDDSLMKEVKLQTNLGISVNVKIGERAHPDTGNVTEYYHCIANEPSVLKSLNYSDLEEFMWLLPEDLSVYMPTLYGEVHEYLTKLGQVS